MKVRTISCDFCGQTIGTADVWLTVHGADLTPLDYCSWDCVADYGRMQSMQSLLPLEPPC
jgi:hypothetical protein